MKKTLSLWIFLCISCLLHAQVGINTENPHSLTELDIYNTLDNDGDIVPKGIMIPRMTEAQRNQIVIDQSSDANSLMIYNTDEDCYNYYSKSRSSWASLCGSMNKAEYNFDCSNIQVFGSYVKNKSLGPIINYLRVTVVVTKTGNYEISATSTNGYGFSISGQFMALGTYTIAVPGMGMPLEDGVDTLTPVNNGVSLNCNFNVTVLPDAGNYTLVCNDYTTNGVFEVGKEVGSSNYITAHVDASSTGSWEIVSDEIDGLSFSGSGEFTSTGPNTVTLYAQGKPTNVKMKNFTLTTNSTDGQEVFCKVQLYVTIPQKRILSLGASGRAINVGDSGSEGAGISIMFSNPNNFGTNDNSKFKTYTPAFLPSQTTALNGNLSGSTISNYLNPTDGTNPVDIVFMAYDADLNDVAAGNAVADYLRKGGVVVMMNEHQNRNGQVQLWKNLYGTTVANSNNDLGKGGDVYQLPMSKPDDMILNGPFGDIRGLYIGEDNGFTDFFTTFDTSVAEWVVYGTNWSAADPESSSGFDRVVAFKAKDYNLFFIGDGGTLGYRPNNTSTTSYAVALDSNYSPIPYVGYGNGTLFNVVNSILGANLFAWALYQSEVNGINSFE